MSDIQRKLIRDTGERVVIRNNHQLGAVFFALAAIPLFVPFRATTPYGIVLTSLGACAFVALGTGLFLWRNSIELDLAAGTCVRRSGFWPRVQRTTGLLSMVTSVRIDERRHRFGRRTTYEVSFTLGGEEAFTFFETPERTEAVEVQEDWLARLKPPSSPDPQRRDQRSAA